MIPAVIEVHPKSIAEAGAYYLSRMYKIDDGTWTKEYIYQRMDLYLQRIKEYAAYRANQV